MMDPIQHDHVPAHQPAVLPNTDPSYNNTNLSLLFSRYVDQLLLGCGSKECTEILCFTGRLNRNSKHTPVRRHTPRAAREIALVICGNPKPGQHLCRHFEDIDRSNDSSSSPESQCDPSSLIQLLCSTKIIRRFQDTSSGVAVDHNLSRFHDEVSRLLDAAGRIPSPLDLDQESLSNKEIAESLLICFDWLLTKLPLELSPLERVDREAIRLGLACLPKHDNLSTGHEFNTCLAILDTLEWEPYLRLLEQMALVISVRRHLEVTFFKAKERQNSLGQRPSVQDLIANRLCDCERGSQGATRAYAVVIWMKKLFTKLWDSHPNLEYRTASHGVMLLLQGFSAIHNRLRPIFPKFAMLLPVVASRIGSLDLAYSFLTTPPSDRDMHVIRSNFLYSQEELSLFFRAHSLMIMRNASSAGGKAVALRERQNLEIQEDDLPYQLLHTERHYLLIYVSRTNTLQDTFDQLWQRRKAELRLPLRVRLGEIDQHEMGHDLGGVQIEFFNIVCKEVFAEGACMFTTDPTTGLSYFRPGSLQPLYMFELFGLLVALALYNGITLPINLPFAFYRLLTRPPMDSSPWRCGTEYIRDCWPAIARSLDTILEQDVPGLDYTFPLEANGLRLSISSISRVCFPDGKERKPLCFTDAALVNATSPLSSQEFDFENNVDAWPGWRFSKKTQQEVEEVTPENKAGYVRDYIHFLCYDSVAPQWDYFRRGFYSSGLISPSTLFLFPPYKLKSHLEGTSHLNIAHLQAVTVYESYDPESSYIASFWRIVTAWPEEKQKRLLKFVTAAERIPITGAQHLTFVIKRAPSFLDPESLPSSSTCFGTMVLPKYASAEILSAKLDLALEYGSEGFGIG